MSQLINCHIESIVCHNNSAEDTENVIKLMQVKNNNTNVKNCAHKNVPIYKII